MDISLIDNKRMQIASPAFTLAEVLITLGIIGIVAAMTMPMLIQKYQNYILKNQFKKVYNTYSNAIQKVVADEGAVPQCFYSENNIGSDWGECFDFYTKLFKTLNPIKICESNSVANGCIPKYETYYTTESSEVCNGFSEAVIKTYSRGAILKDNSILFTYFQGGAPVFAVDINGFKKPNKGGHDLFVFSITKPPQNETLRLNEPHETSNHCITTFNSDSDSSAKTMRQMMLEMFK
ncbi:MAG: prepilin-type N-terminal cleavage/methylation domain-containing protein [Oscillospiraceae bacterium]